MSFVSGFVEAVFGPPVDKSFGLGPPAVLLDLGTPAFLFDAPTS